MANHMLKSVTMLLSILSNVVVVISTITKIIEAITTQRQTPQDVLAGQAAISRDGEPGGCRGCSPLTFFQM